MVMQGLIAAQRLQRRVALGVPLLRFSYDKGEGPATRGLAAEPYWDAERVLGEATFDDSKLPPAPAFLLGRKAAHHAILCSAENRPGVLFSQIPLP